MLNLPYYIIENCIIPYLTSEELFYSFRGVCTDFYINTRNTYQITFPDEMIKNLKNICLLNENENLTLAFTVKRNELFQGKNLLILFSLQVNFSLLIKNLLSQHPDNSELIKLLQLFYIITKCQDKFRLLNDNKIEELSYLLSLEQSWTELKDKIDVWLDFEILDPDISNYVGIFNSINFDLLGTLGDDIICWYKFIGKIIEFQILKEQHQEIEAKLKGFFNQITKTSEAWPKKRKFFETTVTFIAGSYTTNPKLNRFMKLFEKYEIEHPVKDFKNYNAYIQRRFSPYSDIVHNRKLWNEKFYILNSMFKFYEESVGVKKEDYVVDGVRIVEGDFWYAMSWIPDECNVNSDTFKHAFDMIFKS